MVCRCGNPVKVGMQHRPSGVGKDHNSGEGDGYQVMAPSSTALRVR